MSNMRPDGRSSGTPLHTNSSQEPEQAPSLLSGPRPTPKTRVTSPLLHDGVDPASTHAAGRSFQELSSHIKLPKGGQVATAKTTPESRNVAKAGSMPTADKMAQLRTANELATAKGPSMSADLRELCQQLVGLTDQKEGFKTVLAVRPQAGFVAVACHDISQLKMAKAIDHAPLLNHLAATHQHDESNQTRALADVRAEMRGIMQLAFKKNNSASPRGSDMAAYGTRLCRSSSTGKLWFEPSGSFGFNAEAMGHAGLQTLAKLHANLLIGAGISPEALGGHAEHPTLQPLVDATREQMARFLG